MNNIIHPTAIIEDGAILGQNITVGAYSIIKSSVRIGNDNKIGSHTLIEANTVIGENNEIFSHAVLGSIPQDLKFEGEKSFLIIGDNNKIREHTLINTGTKGGGYKTIIGNDCLIMGHVHLGHDAILGNNVIIANSAAVAGHVEIADNVVVGGMSAIHQFVKIGEHAMIGGGSIVIQDIPPYCITEGNRAILRGLNINGLRRRINYRNDIDIIKKAYKRFFESNEPLKDVASELKNSENVFVQKMANFILETKRGIPYIRKNINE